jgi:hypothetical protein
VKDRSRKGLIANWQELIASEDEEKDHHLRRAMYTGLPAGSDDFVQKIELVTGRNLCIGIPGRPQRQS